MYQSTIFGTSVRPLAPPNAVPFHTGPVASWNGRGENLGAGRGDPDHDRLAPAAMAGFQRLPHDRDIAGAIEGVIGAADLVRAGLCHIDEVRDEVLAEIFRVDEMGHAEAFAPSLAIVVDIDPD